MGMSSDVDDFHQKSDARVLMDLLQHMGREREREEKMFMALDEMPVTECISFNLSEMR